MSMDYSPDSLDVDGDDTLGFTLPVLIGIAAVVVLGAGACLGLFMMTVQPFSPAEIAEPPRQPSYDVLTAREAYIPAVTLIRESDPGAQLATGTGIWTPNIDNVYLEAGRTGWTFHFYLPATAEMATVIINRGGDARIAEVIAWNTPPNLYDDQSWEVDSSLAAAEFLGSCQQSLDSKPDNQAQLRLTASRDAGRLMWQTRVLSADNQPLCEVNIDARTGEIR